MTMDEGDTVNPSERSLHLHQLNQLLEKRHPNILSKGIGNTAILLPRGQQITLWMTLHHNFYEGCILTLEQNSEFDEEQRLFFTTLADYFYQFLSVIKTVETSMPLPAMEKISNLLSKFGADCLQHLAASIIDRKHDEDVVHWFLKLSYCWAEHQGIILYYHKDNYGIAQPCVPKDPTATNLTYSLPHLSSKEWQQLEEQVQAFGESCCKEQFVDLVVQKLRYLILLRQNRNLSESDAELLESCIQQASQYICSKLKEQTLLNGEWYSVVSPNLREPDVIDLTRGFLTQFSIQSPSLTGFPNDAKFHFSLVLEILDEILKKLVKAKICRIPLKQLRKEIFASDMRVKIMSEVTCVTDTPEMTKLLEELLSLTNILVSQVQGGSLVEDAVTIEFSEKLIVPYITLLSSLPFEEYSKGLSTLVFLTTLNCLIAMTSHASPKTVDLLATIIQQSASNFVGNQFIFSVHWTQFYSWYSINLDAYSVTAARTLAKIIFQNVYISPKTAEEFDEDFNKLMKSKIDSPSFPVLLTLVEFLTKDVLRHNCEKSKSKVGALLEKHLQEATLPLTKSLKKSYKSGTLPTKIVNLFHSASVVQEAVQAVVGSAKDVESDQFKKLNKVLEYVADAALSHLKEGSTGVKSDPEEDSVTSLDLSRRYALACLLGICKSNDFSPGFITKLWKVYMEIPRYAVDLVRFPEIPVLTAKNVYVAANVAEFEEMTLTINRELEFEAGIIPLREERLVTLAGFLQDLLDVDLTPDKKTVRRQCIEQALYDCLPIFSQCNNTESVIANVNVMSPFLEFLIQLVRRRNAICSTNALSMCLAVLTSVPLNEIAETKIYRKTFCLVGELLNALTIHRIDVLSFRNHIYLQCFQFLVESVTMRSDQKRNLTDEDILDLKYCSHTMERICQSMKLGQKEFSRISPYFIAILMRQFELFTVYPVVKESLLGGCYKVIDLCDDHGIAQLNSMFTPGSREIFKTVYDIYKKFYRYTGKV